ncbi:cyclic nucleotide-binding-like protein [Dunaliella salina]|uniref:Cyclic nucleotide-binding-like protein n=1 Tax=Dunaliella salina TaxID=3046 RepID=A0ABQ7FZ95_DUNSA|nr:cyclic nucleotide-binding-like protein [Dunaliella salina]|eukprot:KAF5827674.1 cyclic nucleotide-binding-like protein [Dunaliella salina]
MQSPEIAFTYGKKTVPLSTLAAHKYSCPCTSPSCSGYFLSLYFSFVILTGFGDNTFYDKNAVESCFVVGYLLICVVLNAYILGSITTVMVSDDERSNTYRERVEALNAFAEQKELPESLKELMREHLELLHHTEATSDEHILHRYPPTLRKKVLRHLYLDILRKCYPFRGCKTRFLEEVMSIAHLEIFNPDVEVVLEGDVVQELYIITEGIVYGARAQSSASQERKSAKLRSRSSKSSNRFGSMSSSGRFSSGRREDSMQSMSNYGGDSMKSGTSTEGGKGGSSGHLAGNSSMEPHASPGAGNDGGHADNKVNTYTTSQAFGHYSFFTDGPCLQDYWTGSLARILILSKAQINDLAARHPKQVKRMLYNLRQQVEEKFRPAVAEALAAQSKSLDSGIPGITGSQSFSPPDGAIEIAPLSNDETEVLQSALAGRASFSLPAVQQPLIRLKGLLPADERCYIQYWQEARDITLEYLRTQEQQNVYQIISAASVADIETVKKLVAWGVSPGSMDYDRRTPLMVAAHANHASVVRYLLEVRAPPNDQDAFGVTAMFEAVRMGHSEIIEVLKEHDAKLGMDEEKTVGIITEAVIAGDLPQLRSLLSIGA